MNASCLDLVRALDPGECHLVEEGLVSVVTHDPRQTQAFDRFLLILGYRHAPPPQYTDQQRPNKGNRVLAEFGRQAKGRASRMSVLPRQRSAVRRAAQRFAVAANLTVQGAECPIGLAGIRNFGCFGEL
jgi:hypothetical protein